MLTFGALLTRSSLASDTEQSKNLPNTAFGYWKVTVERARRLEDIDADPAYRTDEIRKFKATADLSENGGPVIKKIHSGNVEYNPLNGLFATTVTGGTATVEYEPVPDLRDTE